MKQHSSSFPWLMWALPLSFFAYQFIWRLWPGLMMHQIMEQFSIDATAFGVLAAFYYYGYAGMQIPVAILLDRFTPRYIVFAFAVLTGFATILFSYTTNFYLAVFARFLIGAGSAVGFLAVSKVVSEWFPRDKYARMIGLSFSFGLLGAIYGGRPVTALIEAHAWKDVALVLSCISLAIGVSAFFILRSPKNAHHGVEEAEFQLNNFRSILTSPLIWFLGISNLLMVGALEGFADVWGVQYLMNAYDLNKGDAAGLISFLFIGMLFGGPFLAFLSRFLGNYTVIALSGIGMALAFAFLLMSTTYHDKLIPGTFFALGVMGCYQVIVFAAGANLVVAKNLGVTVAFLNCINMLGGSFFHSLIGWLMDFFWTGATAEDGLRIYDLTVYKSALSVVPICALIGAFIVCMVGMKVKRL
jgi:predicted MFS family arabinose efflux permease